MVLKAALFMAVIGAAMLFDMYFDDDFAAFDEIGAEADANKAPDRSVYFIGQSSSSSAKTFSSRAIGKKIQPKSHDKLLQKFHQLRNYQVLKAETRPQTTPLINSYHYLAFKNYFFSDPDDIPLV